ncbi:MAG: hypothetical protein R3F19_11225 [Verrucomicrobiales bacterium]
MARAAPTLPADAHAGDQCRQRPGVEAVVASNGSIAWWSPSRKHQITIKLAYYPPYHSKYNPIERLLGVLRIIGEESC